MLLRITEQAADQIRASIEEGGMQGMALRVAARRLEDGTIDYAMDSTKRVITTRVLNSMGYSC